jgi:hypothetical protein
LTNPRGEQVPVLLALSVSFFGHLKGEFPYLEQIPDAGELESELKTGRSSTTLCGYTLASGTSHPTTTSTPAEAKRSD